MNAVDEILTLDGSSKVAHVSKAHLRKAIRKNELRAIILGPRKILIPRSWLMAWLESKANRPAEVSPDASIDEIKRLASQKKL
ncbi:MAG: excisionase family DNA-binding protein, partial [Methanothrix sp.]|nr:excisionase family DNA-binding protein [Methanothrix sp.]